MNELGGFSVVDSARKWAQVVLMLMRSLLSCLILLQARALNVNTRLHRTAGSKIKAFYKSFHFPSPSVACKEDPETEEISNKIQVGMEIEAEMEDGKGGTEWIRGKITKHDKKKKSLHVFFTVQTETEIGEWTDEYRIEDYGTEWRFITQNEDTIEICEITESQIDQDEGTDPKLEEIPDETIRVSDVRPIMVC